ncbi:phosphopyruvate hydratase [Subtercola boreus]|uniref:Enolase n=1 Tax=Subtercola boreus TaxID=120213 RepID=A0A3E0VC86_9MICO|nr:phosphopyruvate hydratase [Subtercola boreus]RFA06497.1 phosphopyruvate hydratase [Subtercola boreus]TQL46954.1 enolase [Subtercola boreus]
MNDYTGHHNRTITYDAGEYVSHPTGHALTISTVTAEQILDSRGNPTVRVSLRLDDGFEAVASAPAGASTGAFEAVELRDGGSAYGGLGVQGAVTAVRTEIGPLLTHHSYNTISDLDRALRDLDGTPNLARLGANAVVAVSIAATRAFAHRAELPLHRWLSLVTGSAERMPVPHFNVLNGGAHAANALDFQEFMIAPVQAATEAEAVQTGAEIYHALARLIREKYAAAGLGDEGGFAPPIDSAEEALDLLVAAITDAGYTPGVDSIAIAMDPAANGFSLGGGRYRLAGRELARDELVDYYENLVDSYPIRSIEDGFAEDDHEGWIALSERLADRIQLVGDDLYVTDAARILDGAHEHYSTAALIKPNQIGTVSQTLDAIAAARSNGMACMVSHRSGETEDTFIADLAVGTGAGQIKSGAPARGERVAKYNRLTQIEAQNPTIPYGLA